MTPRTSSARRRRRRSPRGGGRALAWIAGAALVLLACGVGAVKWGRSAGGRAALLGLGADHMHADVQAAVEDALRPVLPDLAPGPASRAADLDRPAPALGTGAVIRCRVVAADARPWWRLQEDVQAALAAVGADVLWGERLAAPGRRRGAADGDGDLLRLDVGVDGHPTHTLVLHRPGVAPRVRWDGRGAPSAWQTLAAADGPVVALVIDDWGYGRNATTRALLGLDAPLTLAVLPGLPYSRHFALQATDLVLPAAAAADADDGARVARRAAGCPVEVDLAGGRGPDARRREIMLHLPMEPQSYPDTDPGPRAVMVGMDAGTIAARVDGALTGLPHVRGVNNHMGSAATGDAATMDALMKVLRERGLYFVDSLTTSRSVAADAARAAGLPTASNRIFLDYDNEDPERIAANLAVLVRSARQRGFALGIGHPHAATAAVLAREIPRLQAAGVRFVTVSEWLALRQAAAAEAS